MIWLSEHTELTGSSCWLDTTSDVHLTIWSLDTTLSFAYAFWMGQCLFRHVAKMLGLGLGVGMWHVASEIGLIGKKEQPSGI